MPSNQYQPHLDPSAKALADAMDAKGMNDRQLADRLRLSWNTIGNRRRAFSGVDIPAAKAMAKALDCDWAPLVSPPNTARPRGRPKGSKNKPRTLGPATRALALHETAALRPVQPLSAAIAPPRPTPVLGFELYSDGTSHLALKASLPADRGAALLRQLLDFGLVQT